MLFCGWCEFDEYLNSKIEVFPNPTNDYFYVQINSLEGDFTITLFNSLGQVITTTQVLSETTKMDVSELPSGVYMIKINSTEGSIIKRVIKN